MFGGHTTRVPTESRCLYHKVNLYFHIVLRLGTWSCLSFYTPSQNHSSSTFFHLWIEMENKLTTQANTKKEELSLLF